MNSLEQRQAAATAQQAAHREANDRLAAIASEKFGDANGQELLEHLIKRFDLTGRTFITTERGEVNALRAAVRDGERAAVQHLLKLCRQGNKTFPIPL